MGHRMVGIRWSVGRVAVVGMVFAVLLSLALLVGACSGSDTETTGSDEPSVSSTTITGDSTNTASDSSSGVNRLVVGGKSAEEYEASIPDLQKAVDADPTNLSALQDLAVAQYNSGRLDDAVATYLKMLAIRDDPTVHNNYGNVLRDQKKMDEAKTEYLKAIEGDPALTVAYVNLASIYLSEGDLAGAQKLLDQGIAHTTGEDKTRLEDYKTTISQGN